MSTQPSIFSRLRDDDAHDHDQEWQTFFARYAPVVFNVAVAHGLADNDARDTVQEVMLRFCRNLERFRYDANRGRFRNYLYTVTLNVVRGQLADQARRERAMDPTRMRGIDNAKELWEREWRANTLRNAVEAVSREVDAKTFQAFQLFVLNEWPAEKVAEFLGMNRQSVYQAKMRVIRRLKERMAAPEDDA